MKTLRMLIVEDDPTLLTHLKQLYRKVFQDHGFTITIEQAEKGHEAVKLARNARSQPYDFVSLDVNLGDKEITGLDVLASLKRHDSAWMVAVVTGVETDATLDATMGTAKANQLRRRLRRDAYARFPAERMVLVEKPALGEDGMKSLANRIEQIALLHLEISRLRYIFRPIEVVSLQRIPAAKGKKVKRKFIESVSLHWQIRYDCGDIRTLPDKAGLKTLHRLLSLEENETLTPEQALAIEPRHERRETSENGKDDPVAAFFLARGIKWSELPGPEQEKLITAALSLKFKRYVELRGFEDADDLSVEESDDLERLKGELGPLSQAAETAYLRLMSSDDELVKEMPRSAGALQQDSLHSSTGANYEKTGPGRARYDAAEARSFRKRMERTRDYLRENGFAAFSEHLEAYLMSTGANWSYNPPLDKGIEWTT